MNLGSPNDNLIHLLKGNKKRVMSKPLKANHTNDSESAES
jgi:hypothetical protein